MIGLSGRCRRATLGWRGAGRGRCSGSLPFLSSGASAAVRHAPGRPPAGAGGTYRWTDPVTDRPGYDPGCSGATETVLAVGMGGRTRRPGVLMHAECDSRGMGRAATKQPPLEVSGASVLGLTSGNAVALRRASQLPIGVAFARSCGASTSRSDYVMGSDSVARMPAAAAPERSHRITVSTSATTSPIGMSSSSSRVRCSWCWVDWRPADDKYDCGVAGAPPETVTVLFTDAVGSTEWRARQGDELADARVSELERGSRLIVEAAGGIVVKGVGDGVMATFRSAVAALTAATDLRDACSGAWTAW